MLKPAGQLPSTEYRLPSGFHLGPVEELATATTHPSSVSPGPQHSPGGISIKLLRV